MEIKHAAAKLTADEQKQLLRFLLSLIPADEADLPQPRQFSQQEIHDWLAEDEASMQRLRDGK